MPSSSLPNNSMQAKQKLLRIGVDTGGTFTDFALYKNNALITHKVLSTPDSPEQAILQGIDELGLKEQCQTGKLLVIHGSTVATNAALENKGAKTCLLYTSPSPRDQRGSRMPSSA